VSTSASPEPSVRTEYRWVIWASLGIMLLASVPYIWGYGIAPSGSKFIGFTRNADDACVYLSWMRQAADGHFFLRNLFTTEPQRGLGFNLLFFVLGSFARFTHIPLTAVFHIFRIVFGVALLTAAYGFSGIWLKEVRSRRIALLVVGLSSGIGWLFPLGNGIHCSVDLWQPEAITFLSLYLAPLFIFPMLLMIGTLYFLHRFTETGVWRNAVYAGLILFALANVHTYDLITLALTWACYSAYRLARNPGNTRVITGGLVAALIAAPSVGYQLYFYTIEPIFRTRAAVPTISPPIWYYLTGYGLLVPLALIGVRQSVRDRRDTWLLVCWVLAGFVAAYLPVAFQRKLIMGTHIPLSLLAAMGLIALISFLRPRWRDAVLVIVLLLLVPSNLYFMQRDIRRVAANQSFTTAHVPFISDDELAALDYIRAHTGDRDIILAPPGTAILIPGHAGRMTYCGHWGETVDFSRKLGEVYAFYSQGTDDRNRRTFLMRSGITYMIAYRPVSGVGIHLEDFGAASTPYLRKAFEAGDVSVYQVVREAL
jgi:hypothetical protein